MRITSQQVHSARHAVYKIWDGEVIVDVTQLMNIEDCLTVIINITRQGLAASNEIRVDVWYKGDRRLHTPREWIAQQLTSLSFRRNNTSSEIEGIVEGKLC